MADPFRVTLVARSLMMGGIERHIVKLCNELVRENISISVCLLIKDEPKDLIHELPPRTKLYICPYHRHDLRTVFWLANIIRSEKSQLVHSFSWHADFYASFLKILVPKLVVIGSERGDRGDQNFYKSVYNWIDRLWVFNAVDGFCANSDFGKCLLVAKGCKTEKTSVIHNGVNLDVIDSEPVANIREDLGWSPSSTVFCIVSRLVYYKGIGELIRVIQFCDSRLRFLIIGDGPQKLYLQQIINDLSLNDRVVLVGQRNPATPFIKGSDICMLVTRSNTEHCSNSILEYMACGKPVVATNVAGNPELIISGYNGFLVDPGHMEGLPVLLNQMASDHTLIQQMGTAGRERVEKIFQMKDVANQFYLLWQTYYGTKVWAKGKRIA